MRTLIIFLVIALVFFLAYRGIRSRNLSKQNKVINKGKSVNNTTIVKKGSSEITVSSGYMDKKEFIPTIDEKGEYKTIDGKGKQIQYQGSKEQKSDLDAIDEYAKTHPDF